MKVVSDASPIIAFASIDCRRLLHQLFDRVFISSEVYREIVVVGIGPPGAEATAQADWIGVTPIPDSGLVAREIQRTGLPAGKSARFFWQSKWERTSY